MAVIESEADIYELGIIDFNRLNGYWRTIPEAMKTIFSWFEGANYRVVQIPIGEAPKRSDFPGWNHAGNHEFMGNLYWNWLKWKFPLSALHFSDSPDFYGTLKFDDGTSNLFWGDIGIVSASAMAFTQKQMGQGDLWITVHDDGTFRQTIIEPRISLRRTYGMKFASFEGTPEFQNGIVWSAEGAEWILVPGGKIYKDKAEYGLYDEKTNLVSVREIDNE